MLECVTRLKEMEAQYSVMHTEYEKLQADANKMGAEQKIMQQQLTEMSVTNMSRPPEEMDAANAAFTKLQNEVCTCGHFSFGYFGSDKAIVRSCYQQTMYLGTLIACTFFRVSKPGITQ